MRDPYRERLFFNDKYIANFNTMVLKYANIEPIEEAEDSGASEGKAEGAGQARPHPYLQLHDSTKFLDFSHFVGSLAFLFKDKPEEMRSFVKDELLAIYTSKIKSRRDEILGDGELSG